MNRVLVTGASGFVGRHLARRLSREGVPFRALVRSEAAAREVRRLGAEPFRGDLTVPDSLGGLGRGIDTVLHCAGKVDLWGPRSEFTAVNVEGLAALVGELARFGRPRVVHLSSASVHGDRLPRTVDESMPLSRIDEPYVASKVQAERLLNAAHERGEIEGVILRPVHIYGPGSQIVEETMGRIRSGGRILISFTRGTMPLVFVEDLVDAIMLAARSDRSWGQEDRCPAFFVRDGGSHTWNDFVRSLAGAAKLTVNSRPISPRVAALAAGAFECAWTVARIRSRPPLVRAFLKMIALEADFSIAQARRIGFEPRHDLAAGMRITVSELVPHHTRNGNPP